jgi:hypothetical protein
MRFHDITPGANFKQIQIEFEYIIAHNIGKRFMGYMCDGCWGNKTAGEKIRDEMVDKQWNKKKSL